ncbi:hypothetical protein U0070_011582 [Myodes glareolus]|uniref:Lipocalin/cytosolic fatty-acid binding domain-containing protein n=1 Tax=Myodes glareolus TaxID=447135 RepID=A0AAW0H219_MYOGA
MLRSGLLRIFSATGSCRGLLHVVPGAMTLVRAWLLFVAFNIDLAQENLEEVPVQPDFDAHKVEGRWFTIQLATSHRDLVLPTDPLRLSLYSIQTRDSGDVDFVLFEKGEGVCTGINVTVHPAGLPGQYQGTCEYFLGNPGAMLKREVQLGVTDALHRAQHLEELPALGRLHNPPSGVTVSGGEVESWGQRAEAFPVTRFSTVEGGSMNVHFVSTDYNNLILYVCFEDSEVTNLWALLARRMLEDPTWLGKYLVFIEKFHLHKAPIFNIAGKRCPSAAPQLFKETSVPQIGPRCRFSLGPLHLLLLQSPFLLLTTASSRGKPSAAPRGLEPRATSACLVFPSLSVVTWSHRTPQRDPQDSPPGL